MGFKYNITTNDKYFLTITVVDWVDVFTRKELANVIIDALNYCIEHKRLQVYAWCLMPSHLHLIASVEDNESAITLSDIMRDFKKFTSKKIIETIQHIPESRREWLLNKFEFAGRYNPKIKNYKFWQDGLHSISITSNKFTDQKLDYVHQNPVEAGIVYKAEDYILSSAAAYAGELPALVNVIFLR